MADDLIVPEIHVQGQLVIDAFHIKSGHVAYNALQWSVNLYFGQEQIGEHMGRIARLFVPVMLGAAFDPRNFTAFVRIRVGEDKACVEPDLGI